MSTFRKNRIDCHRPGGRARSRGFSLLEVVVSTMLVGIVMVGALRVLASSLHGADVLDRQSQSVLLADELMAEILRQPYDEPAQAPIGILGGILGGGFADEGFLGSLGGNSNGRAEFDSVDDYNNWTASPPQERDGTERNWLEGWERRVSVTMVDADDLTTTAFGDSGVKRIVVEVLWNGQLEARLQSVQTAAWINMIPQPTNNRTTGSYPGE